MNPVRDPFRRVWIGLAALVLVIVAGTGGYLALGFGPLDAVYQTLSTVTTVGFNSPHPLDANGKALTIVLIVVGVGTALYTMTVILEIAARGSHARSREEAENGPKHRTDEQARDRLRLGACRARGGPILSEWWTRRGRHRPRPDRLGDILHASVCGDVTDDETLRRAGIDRARTLVTALDTDADNLYVTVAAKSMQPDLQVIARARSESSEPKLVRAGADRVVNPQQLGGDRMASFVTQPHVVDFVDVVMHDGTLKFRLGELAVSAESNLANNTLRSAHLRDRTGALVLAIRRPDGSFVTNPSPEATIEAGDVLISVGTADQLEALDTFATQ